MKKILTSIILLTLGFFSFRICNVNASEDDASVNDYNISSNWEYKDDETHEFEEVYGSRYYEGKMRSWMGIYTHLNEKTNEMYVLTMCSAMMQSNQKNYWDQKRWNNQEMKIEMFPESKDTSSISLINYAPETSEGTTSWTSSVGISGTDLTAGFEQTNTSSDVTVKVLVPDNQNNKIEIYHKFKNYKSNTNIDDVCCALVKKKNYTIFKIKNYNAHNKYSFCIYFTATFYRLGVFNSASVSQRQTTNFTI